MRAATLLLAALFCGLQLGAEDSARFAAPSYSIASTVNAATNQSGSLAPNTFVAIYGENLSYETRAIMPEDLNGIRLPTRLPGTGVSVLVGSYPAHIFYVSPNQVNLLVPSLLRPGRTHLQLVRDGRAGPKIEIVLASAAPALFQLDATTAIVTRANGSLVSWELPARQGDIVTLYATGLGPTDPETPYGTIPGAAAWLRRLSEFRVLLDGVTLDPRDVLYAGVSPGTAGLYQVNVRLPGDAARNPELRLTLGHEMSPPGIYLPLQPDD